jgi:hypothetical protein
MAQRALDAPLQARVAQQPMEGGLFGDQHLQDELFGTSGRANFAQAASQPLPDGLAEVVARIEANTKASGDDLARLISDAEAEGIDPETGTHDLADDLASIKEQDVLSADDTAALSAADQSFDAALAWEEVVDVARKCVLK